jgi:hypothetical protein
MTTLMKAVQPHWLGNKFVPIGTVLPEGHPEAVGEFYEAYEIAEPADPIAERAALDARATELGLKTDRRKSDDTVRAEIVAAEAVDEKAFVEEE